MKMCLHRIGTCIVIIALSVFVVYADDAQPPLFQAIQNGDLKEVKGLLTNGTSIIETWKDLTPLMMACTAKQPDIVQYLLAQGADIRQSTAKGTALRIADWGSYAAPNQNQLKIVDLLIANLIVPNKKSNSSARNKAIRVPSSEDIKLGIRAAIIRNMDVSAGNFIAIHLYDVIVVDAGKSKYRILCDIAAITKDRQSMFELTSSSRLMIPPPDSVKTHMCYIRAGENNTMVAKLSIDDDLPRWSFLFSPGKDKKWIVDVQKN